MSVSVATPSPVRRAAATGTSEILRQIEMAWFFAWSDTKARYKRSVLGPFWLVLGTVIGVAGLGFVWSILMKTDRATFVPTLTIGLVVWYMISGSITSAATVFAVNASVIKNIRTPSLRISLQLLFQQIVNFAHNLLVVAMIMLIYPQTLSLTALLALPAIILVWINLLWVIQLLGFLGARYRDFDPLVNALMPILFFLSPVMFRASQLGGAAVAMKFNPLAYWIDIVRQPLQGTVPDASSWTITIAIAVAGWGLALWVTRAKGSRLAYWI